jgi:choline transporter-like protein 2/4/5
VMQKITSITFISIIVARKSINKCAAIIKEATTVFKDMPFMMLFPTLSSIAQAAVIAVFVLGLCFLRTLKPESIDKTFEMVPNATLADEWGFPEAAAAVDPIAALRDLHENDNVLLAATLLFIYGFFVMLQYVQSLAWATMSAATGYWYYFKGDKETRYRFPIARSLAIQTIFHTGSIAFAAFIIAIFDFIRFCVMYIDRQMNAGGKKPGLVVQLAMKALLCCISCIKKTVEMISYYGLVFVAVNGTSFCGGCAATFRFMANNLGQVSINALIVWLLKMFSLGTVPVACSIVIFYVAEGQGNASPFWPAFIVLLAAFVMTQACMTVFEAIVTTIFVCSFEDKAKYGGKYMAEKHPHLAKALSVKKKKGEEAKGEPAAEEPLQKL